MNPFKRATRRSILASECGQMAIFIALIFQVLFVFFAMVINIGLLIHDKINLQNSVDLGAYYGAQKQAEMLNEIGQINYQMRQDYKLLTWRSRVLGTFGRATHPQRAKPPLPPNTDELYEDPVSDLPGICITHSFWDETRVRSETENLCNQKPDVRIPEIPAVRIDFPAPYNFVIQSIVDRLRTGYSQRCDEAGPLNWVFTAQLLNAYRDAGALRKRMVSILSKNMSSPIAEGDDSFRDKYTDPVYTGIRNTIVNNLTQANRDSDFQMEVINGLAQGDCGQIDGEYPKWIREIPIDPILYYIHFLDASGCTSRVMPHMFVPGFRGPDGKDVAGNPDFIKKFDPDGNLRVAASSEPPLGSFNHSSRGFEKNPWCMAYVGVKAHSRPRKPFSPFGAPITLEARAFAAPFGGRVGPWENSAWPAGADASDGGEKVDKLAVPKTSGAAREPILYAPNYSRFPGDTLGLKSRMALAATKGSMYQMALDRNKTDPLSVVLYKHFGEIGKQGDVLAWDGRFGDGRAPWIRDAEVAAVTPDIFDVTYYSIEPTYFANYFNFDPVKRYRDVAAISDIGSRLVNNDLRAFGVSEQIKNTQSRHLLQPDAYWVIKDTAHALTGWTQPTSTSYAFPTSLFGHCGAGDRPKPGTAPAMGDCSGGGRTGYAVRLVHKDYLLFKNHVLGGASRSGGPLRNAPPSDF